MHSAVAQADGARAAGQTVRREPIETIHPVVRVHPVTGWKSVYVNPGEWALCFGHVPPGIQMQDPRGPCGHDVDLTTAFGVPILTGFTRRIIGVPKAESDAILRLLFHQIA